MFAKLMLLCLVRVGLRFDSRRLDQSGQKVRRSRCLKLPCSTQAGFLGLQIFEAWFEVLG
jgi:hypothetical protein